MRQKCEECGDYVLCNDEGICAFCEEDDIDMDDWLPEDEEDWSSDDEAW